MQHDIIIPVHNAPADTAACLNSLLAASADFARLIVIDDASESATVEVITHRSEQSPKMSVITLPERLGYTRVANLGLRESSAEIKTLLNSDTLVVPGWTAKVESIFARLPEVGIVGPLSNAASTQSVPDVSGSKDQTAINALPAGIGPAEIDAFCAEATVGWAVPYTPLIHGFCMSISAGCLAEVGFFDEEAFPRGYGEENDFCFRAGDAGFVLAVAIDTYVFHAKSKSYSPEERVPLMQAGMKKLVEKHSARRVSKAIEYMRKHPTLASIRRAVEEKFYC